MAGQHIRFAPVELPDSRQVRVQRLYPKTILKPAVRTMLVPVPKTAAIGGQPLRDNELLAWCGEVIRSVLADLAVGVLWSYVPLQLSMKGRGLMPTAVRG